MSGKGHAVRPRAITDAEWDENHARTFGSPEQNIAREQANKGRWRKHAAQAAHAKTPASASPQEAPCGWPGCSPDCDPENDHP